MKSNEGEYKVGKGKPPLHTRFKPGEKSANPNGRPRKLSPEEQARRKLRELLEEKVTIREGQRSMRISALEVYVRKLRQKALTAGCIKAGREWLELSIKFGALFSQSDSAEIALPNHKEIVERFLERARGEQSSEKPVESKAEGAHSAEAKSGT